MDRIIDVGIARVDEMHDEASALDVAEEADAKAGTQMGAFDKSREIGDDESAAEFGAVATRAAIRIDDAEIGLESGERIICDFRTRCGNYGNQCGFAGVRETDEADIGEQFQFEAQMALFAGETVFVFTRSLMPGLGKILVAAAAASALRDE